MPKVAVVIPCYNTSARCVSVIEGARRAADAVLAIDDGSTDDTLQHIQRTGCPHLRFAQNRGKGAALRAGIAEVLKGPAGLLDDDFDYILTVDGDGQHDVAAIPRFVDTAMRQQADLVLGVRDLGAMPPKSRIGNYTSRALFWMSSGRYLQDTQSGFRLIAATLAAALLPVVAWRRFEAESDVLLKTVALGFSVATVEIPTIYFDGNRRTQFDPLWDSLRVIGVLGRYALVSLAVTVLDLLAFALLVTYGGGHVVRANAAARLIAVAMHFILSREFAFRVRGRFHVGEVVRYALAVAINLALTTWLLLVLHEGGMPILLAKIVAQLLGFASSFVLLNRVVFRRPTPAATDWEQYYRRPVVTARWSRMIMENELVRVFREFAPRRQPLSALEIGGGNSCFLPRLMAEFQIAPYTLLDRSEEGMRLARERFGGAYGGRVDYAFADVFNAQFNRKYDVVFSVGLLEHFDAPQIDELIRLHKRWVRDDGLVLIAVPTPTASYHVVRWIAEVLGLWQFHDERPIARRHLVDLMRRRRLTILSERTLWLQLLTQSVIAARPQIEEKLEAAG